jgi:excisionase family DNA binding protein
MARDNWTLSGRTSEDEKQAQNCPNEGWAPLPKMLTTQQAADYWGVKKDKVLGWIRARALHAIDVRSSESTRVQYRIPREAVEAFNASRCNFAWPVERKEERLGRGASRPSSKIEFFR